MAKTRKTFNIEDFVCKVNQILASSIMFGEGVCTKDIRRGVIVMVENVLFDAGIDNYKGFSYLDASEVPEGELPGIVWNGDTPSFPDETRRKYSI